MTEHKEEEEPQNPGVLGTIVSGKSGTFGFLGMFESIGPNELLLTIGTLSLAGIYLATTVLDAKNKQLTDELNTLKEK